MSTSIFCYFFFLLHYIHLITLATSYIADSDCSVVRRCYLWLVTSQSVKWLGTESWLKRGDAASKLKQQLLELIYFMSNQTQKTQIHQIWKIINIGHINRSITNPDMYSLKVILWLWCQELFLCGGICICHNFNRGVHLRTSKATSNLKNDTVQLENGNFQI